MTALRRFASRICAYRIYCLSERAFHSDNLLTPALSSSAVDDAILSAAYSHVPKHGFSNHSLRLGAHDIGYLDISPSIISDGIFRLIGFHLASQRLRLAQKYRTTYKTNGRNTSYVGTGTEIADIMWARLLANMHIIHKWQEALAIMAHPKYVPVAVRELAMLSDEIWYLAGDKSVDFSWYTKRASLSIVYSASELFMTNDKSPGFIDTHNFMSRRLDETATVAGLVGGIRSWTIFTMNSGVSLLKSKGVRI